MSNNPPSKPAPRGPPGRGAPTGGRGSAPPAGARGNNPGGRGGGRGPGGRGPTPGPPPGAGGGGHPPGGYPRGPPTAPPPSSTTPPGSPRQATGRAGEWQYPPSGFAPNGYPYFAPPTHGEITSRIAMANELSQQNQQRERQNMLDANTPYSSSTYTGQGGAVQPSYAAFSSNGPPPPAPAYGFREPNYQGSYRAGYGSEYGYSTAPGGGLGDELRPISPAGYSPSHWPPSWQHGIPPHPSYGPPTPTSFSQGSSYAARHHNQQQQYSPYAQHEYGRGSPPRAINPYESSYGSTLNTHSGYVGGYGPPHVPRRLSTDGDFVGGGPPPAFNNHMQRNDYETHRFDPREMYRGDPGYGTGYQRWYGDPSFSHGGGYGSGHGIVGGAPQRAFSY